MGNKGAVEVEGEPASAAMPCELWTQETWTLDGEPEVHRDPKIDSGTVDAPLVWGHDAVTGLDSVCRVELRARNGNVIAAKKVRGPTSPWAGRQKRFVLTVRFEVARPGKAASAGVRCLARGQSFDTP